MARMGLHLISNIVTLFVVLDPVGSIPIFLIATAGLASHDRRKVALISVFVALVVLMLFLWCGQYIFDQMHIGVPAFRIAGGAILFVFALQMILSGHHQSGASEPTRTPLEIAIFPVAMPSIAGPGALLAVVLLTDYNQYSIPEQAITAALTIGVLGVVLAALLLADKIQRFLGSAGIMVMTQIMGLILAAFAVQQILDGLVETLGRGVH
ncbi:MAG TPA: MarC family protein [Rhizomicrobium sp.]|jgi:multiple antibiotic resistance protein|nr:MarC family protein [Rhizomicrobium sp.]